MAADSKSLTNVKVEKTLMEEACVAYTMRNRSMATQADVVKIALQGYIGNLAADQDKAKKAS